MTQGQMLSGLCCGMEYDSGTIQKIFWLKYTEISFRKVKHTNIEIKIENE